MKQTPDALFDKGIWENWKSVCCKIIYFTNDHPFVNIKSSRMYILILSKITMINVGGKGSLEFSKGARWKVGATLSVSPFVCSLEVSANTTHLQRSSSTACYLQTWYRNSQVVEMLRIKLNPVDTGTCPQNLPRETVRNFRRVHRSYKIRGFYRFGCVQKWQKNQLFDSNRKMCGLCPR